MEMERLLAYKGPVVHVDHSHRVPQRTGELVVTVCDLPGVCSAHRCKFYVTNRLGYTPFFTEYEYTLTTFDEFNNPRMRPEELDRVWEKLFSDIVRMRLLLYRGPGDQYDTIVDGHAVRAIVRVRLLRYRGPGDQYDTIVDGHDVVRAIGEKTPRYVDPAEETRDKNRLKAVLEEGWNTPGGPTLYLAR